MLDKPDNYLEVTPLLTLVLSFILFAIIQTLMVILRNMMNGLCRNQMSPALIRNSLKGVHVHFHKHLSLVSHSTGC